MDRVEDQRAPGVPLSAAAPLICVAHCLAAPFFVVVAPALAENKTVEIGLMMVSAAIAIAVLVLGVRMHGESLVWVPMMVGLALWVVGIFSPGEMQEQVLMVSGGFVLAAGLFWDARLRHRASCSSCSAGH